MEVYEGTAVQIQVHSLHVTRHIMMYGNITNKLVNVTPHTERKRLELKLKYDHNAKLQCIMAETGV